MAGAVKSASGVGRVKPGYEIGSLDGRKIASAEEVTALVGRHEPGDKIVGRRAAAGLNVTGGVLLGGPPCVRK